MRKHLELIIEGRVQGVGFRYFVYNHALRHDIAGYVKNSQDGDVEIICSGEEKDLSAFMEEIKKGPSFSHVLNVKVKERSEKEDFDNFEIRY